MRNSEGDPHVKGRIRKLQREMAKRRMMQEVPKADVVITNPTHVAVASEVRPPEDVRPCRGRHRHEIPPSLSSHWAGKGAILARNATGLGDLTAATPGKPITCYLRSPESRKPAGQGRRVSLKVTLMDVKYHFCRKS